MALVAGGAIMLFAVHVRTSFLNLETAGLILFVTGLSWLWIPVRDKRALLRRALARIQDFVERDVGPANGIRRPLAELLGSELDPAADPASRPPSAAEH